MNINLSQNTQQENLIDYSYAQDFERLNQEKIFVLKTTHLNTRKMGLNGNGVRLLDLLMSYAREQKTVNQKYISRVLNLSLVTINSQIVKMERLGYIESFFNKKTDCSLSYKINYQKILTFLNEGFIKRFKDIYLDLTQWLLRNLKHINTIHSSYLNKRKSTKSNIDAKVEENEEKVLLNSDQKKKINQRRQELKEKAKIKPKPNVFARPVEKLNKTITKVKQFVKSKIKPSENDCVSTCNDMIDSLMNQNKNRKEEIPIYEKFPKNPSPVPLNKKIENKNLTFKERVTLKKLREKYGADEYCALIALNNARRNPDIRNPYGQVISSEKAFRVNLDQGLKYQEMLRENQKIARKKDEVKNSKNGLTKLNFCGIF